MNNNDDLHYVDSTDANENILDTFRYIGGRRFHNVMDSKYFLPNDIGEVDRLEGQHYLYRHIWQGNFSAPVHQTLRKNGACVLDVGCGPGTWVVEMAYDFPSAIFVGLDISPIFPSDQKKPPNATFLQLNILDGLPFPDDTFDFIYQRFLASAIEESQWKYEVISELVRVTKPGGWIEIMEVGTVVTDNIQTPIFHQVNCALLNFLASRDINGLISSKLGNIMAEIHQLANIQCEVRETPVGQWGGRLGEMVFLWPANLLYHNSWVLVTRSLMSWHKKCVQKSIRVNFVLKLIGSMPKKYNKLRFPQNMKNTMLTM
ncbi:6107_t:CDS:2 [Acaulospora morrowiae]|uniref:6107_t:CDS:1 n=1 Tax=Acaulospora morrowiae TaxID=94023 RepID=A0A9N8Z6C0_9GLOM|nr:6107_t:CDS:2 [Acaulospora morrowiae]